MVASLLGIPLDPHENSSLVSRGIEPVASNLDPRSPEFQQILTKLSKSFLFLRSHRDIRDSQKYLVWLEKLQNRAMSLIARAMRDLLERTSKTCQELYQQKLYRNGNKLVLDDMPIESAPIYQKFRGLSFRMRELSQLLRLYSAEKVVDNNGSTNGKRKSSKTPRYGKSNRTNGAHSEQEISVIHEVIQSYVVVRNELLLPFVKDAWKTAISSNSQSPRADNNKSKDSKTEKVSANSPLGLSLGDISLGAGIRQAYSTLLRVTQLEQQLFESLFDIDTDLKNPKGESDSLVHSKHSNYLTERFLQENMEVLNIIQAVSNVTRDFLRPLIIRESSVDELCKVVSTLSEDVRSQMLAMAVPKQLLNTLLSGLDSTVSDAKERLSYCAETALRQEVELFEPKQGHLAYPDLLETFVSTRNKGKSSDSLQQLSLVNPEPIEEITNVYQTWYPPLRSTLSLLSKLYGVVESKVFEDFARRSIAQCIISIKVGSDRVKRMRPALHGDLFLVRHLLVLREQLAPFELRLQGVERYLDFSPTGVALANFVSNSRTALRFDTSNAIFQFAQAGVPQLAETAVDAKKDLDTTLKAACISLKISSLKMLLGPVDAFMAKVKAFIGEIPYYRGGPEKEDAENSSTTIATQRSDVAMMSQDARNSLKGQAFIRADRIKEMLENTQTIAMQNAPELKSTLQVKLVYFQTLRNKTSINGSIYFLQLYIDNPIARNILTKPIFIEFDIVKKKMVSSNK